MCGPYFNEKAQPPVKNYDIHIYFEPGTRSESAAQNLGWQIVMQFPDAVIKHDVQKVGIVGPHLTPNFEVDIKPEAFGKVVSWLQRNSEGLSILIHPHSGDDVKDHLEQSMWLGKQLPYNDAFFAKLQAANQNDTAPKKQMKP